VHDVDALRGHERAQGDDRAGIPGTPHPDGLHGDAGPLGLTQQPAAWLRGHQHGHAVLAERA
jgi:hypothetical protein